MHTFNDPSLPMDLSISAHHIFHTAEALMEAMSTEGRRDAAARVRFALAIYTEQTYEHNV